MSGSGTDRKRRKKRKTRSERNKILKQYSKEHSHKKDQMPGSSMIKRGKGPQQEKSYSLRYNKGTSAAFVPVDYKKATAGTITQDRLTTTLGMLANSKSSDWMKRGVVPETEEMKKKVEDDLKRILTIPNRNSGLGSSGDFDCGQDQVPMETEQDHQQPVVGSSSSKPDTMDVAELVSFRQSSHKTESEAHITNATASTSKTSQKDDKRKKNDAFIKTPSAEPWTSRAGRFSSLSPLSERDDEELDKETPIDDVAEALLKEVTPKFRKMFPKKDIEKEICFDLQKLFKSRINDFDHERFERADGRLQPGTQIGRSVLTSSSSTLTACRRPQISSPTSAYMNGEFGKYVEGTFTCKESNQNLPSSSPPPFLLCKGRKLRHTDSGAAPGLLNKKANRNEYSEMGINFNNNCSSDHGRKENVEPSQRGRENGVHVGGRFDFQNFNIMAEHNDKRPAMLLNLSGISCDRSDSMDSDEADPSGLSRACLAAFVATGREMEKQEQLKTAKSRLRERDLVMHHSSGPTDEEASSAISGSQSSEWQPQRRSSIRFGHAGEPSTQGERHRRGSSHGYHPSPLFDANHKHLRHQRRFDVKYLSPIFLPGRKRDSAGLSDTDRGWLKSEAGPPPLEVGNFAHSDFNLMGSFFDPAMTRRRSARLTPHLVQSRNDLQMALDSACRLNSLRLKPNSNKAALYKGDFCADVRTESVGHGSMTAKPLSELRLHQADLQRQARDFLDELDGCGTSLNSKPDTFPFQQNRHYQMDLHFPHKRQLFQEASPASNGSPVWLAYPSTKDIESFV